MRRFGISCSGRFAAAGRTSESFGGYPIHERGIMSTYQSQLDRGSQTQQGGGFRQDNPNPMVQAAQQGSVEAMEFQLWVSQQATSLAKLKIFSSMAKNVNDQQ